MRRLACGLLAALALAGCTERAERQRPAVVPAAGGETWRRLEATLRGPHDPDSENRCVRGSMSCVRDVVAEMTRRYRALLRSCDHNAAFAFMYLQVTEGVDVGGASRFRDPSWLNHLDSVFARLYFEAFDAWQRGDQGRVPMAWRVAFEAADARAVTGLGDMLLGMNAHISRDLPYALAEVGQDTDRSGREAKRDFDAVNALLDEVQEPMLAAASERIDPTVKSFAISALNFTSADVADLLATWRAEAWGNGRDLAAARTPTTRAAVRQRIERNAESRARVLHAASSYVLTGERTRTRDEFCAAANG
jgi:uncharacterized protein DUF5995